MKAYFGMNNEIYKDEKNIILVFLNKMSKERGSTFAKGWYLKLISTAIPKSKKTFTKLCEAFEETFILKDLKDQAHQTVYFLSMDQFNGDFDQYSTAFRLAQVRSRINLDSILVDALQRGVTSQLLQSFFLIVLFYFSLILVVYLLGEVDVITPILLIFSFTPYLPFVSLTFL